MTQPAKPADLVTVNIDGKDIAVPKGTNVIEAAKLVGVEIPHYCYHPKLSTRPPGSRRSTGSRARRSAAAPTPRRACTFARTPRW
jgi:hypothetical protein